MWRTRASSALPTRGNRVHRQSDHGRIVGAGAWIPAAIACVGLLAACGESSPQEPHVEPSEAATEAPAKPRPETVAPIVEALREPDSFARAAKLATLLPTLDAEAGRNVHLLLRDPTLELGNVESALLVRFWSQHEPEAASDWALFHSPLSRRGAAIEIAYANWAGIDPQAAAQDLLAFIAVPGPFARDAEIALVEGWFASGKPGLVDYIKSLGVGFARQRAVATYALELVNRDGPEAAIAWADSVGVDDEAFKKAVLRQTASAVALQDPLRAAAWCDRICDDPNATNVRAMVAQRWAAQDGRAAMEWVEKAPAGQERDWAARSAFWGWWRRDREAFEQWIAASVDGQVPPWIDNAVEVYAAQLAGGEQYERAIGWGERMVDEKTRARTLINVARIWRKNDEAAAEAWLEGSPLSEEDRERVRNPKPGREVQRVKEDEADAE